MKKIVLSLIVMLIAVFSAKALVYTVVVPEGTKACYIAGSMTDWKQVQMEQDADEPTIFTIDLPEATTADKYKYCCGPGWAWVEKNATGGEILDRSYPDDGMFIDYVETWALEYDPELDNTFILNVTVPEGTKAVYVNGSFNDWSGFERLEKVTETTYTITVRVLGAKSVNYKYASGPSWDYEELQEDGSSLPTDRNLAEPESDDVVAMWKEIYEPPSGGITLNVTVPEGTKVCYVAGSMTGWKQQQMKRVTATTYTITFDDEELDAIEYKYCSGPDWKYEELQEDGKGVDNRKLTLADSPADDVVESWKEVFAPVFTLTVTVPEGTNACYIAGSMNGWTQEKMEKVDDTTYTITFEAESGEIEYKYCSGPDWKYEELQADGSGLQGNRKLMVSNSPAEDVVGSWKEVYAGIINLQVDNTIIVGSKAAISVQFTGIASIELYSIQGVLINKTVTNSIYNYGGLSAGIYIVKVNNKAYKAVVQ